MRLRISVFVAVLLAFAGLTVAEEGPLLVRSPTLSSTRFKSDLSASEEDSANSRVT